MKLHKNIISMWEFGLLGVYISFSSITLQAKSKLLLLQKISKAKYPFIPLDLPVFKGSDCSGMQSISLRISLFQ